MFEWDPEKAIRNLEKHGVSFEEAATIFADKFARILFDEEHSEDEDRYIMFGMSANQRLLAVGYTERAPKVRLITARVADPSERRDYEEQKD